MNSTTPSSEKAEPVVLPVDLRDYFAAKAMHQFVAGAFLPPGYDATEAFALIADRAYEMADAMLKARVL